MLPISSWAHVAENCVVLAVGGVGGKLVGPAKGPPGPTQSVHCATAETGAKTTKAAANVAHSVRSARRFVAGRSSAQPRIIVAPFTPNRRNDRFCADCP